MMIPRARPSTGTVLKPRHNFVYLSADISRPYRFIVTPHIRRSELFPGGSLVLALCRVGIGAAGLD
jgi:hypothetical protein